MPVLRPVSRGVSLLLETYFLWAKFYLGQKEGCSLGGSTSDSSERLLQRGYWGGQYIRFRGRGSSMQSNTYFTRGFLLLDTFEAQSLLPSQLSWFWLSNAFLISLQLFIIHCVIHMATLLCILVHCWYWWKKINSQSEKKMENCIPVSLRVITQEIVFQKALRTVLPRRGQRFWDKVW